MHIPVAREVLPFLLGCLGLFGCLAIIMRFFHRRRSAVLFLLLALVSSGYMLYFFRDPVRHPPPDYSAILAGADGKIMHVKELYEPEFLKTNAVRVSIFLSLFDVHVNRAPLAGKVTFLQYYPGSRYFTFQEKSSEFNQHSSILIEGEKTCCLVNQIVGPVARRVVYWLELDQAIAAGERIGMMKFGSRLDMYFPKDDVEITVRRGDFVRAGESIIGTIRKPPSEPSHHQETEIIL